MTCHHRYIKGVEVLFKKPSQAVHNHVLTIRRAKLGPWIIIELSLAAPDVSIACFSWCSIYSQYSNYCNWRTSGGHWAAHLTHDVAKKPKDKHYNFHICIQNYVLFSISRTIDSSRGTMTCSTLYSPIGRWRIRLYFEFPNKIQVRAPPFVVCGKQRIATINAYSGLSSIPLKLTFPCNFRV